MDRLLIILTVLALGLIAAHRAPAQSTSAESTASPLDPAELLKRIQQLEERIQELEGRLSGPAAAPAKDASLAEAAPAAPATPAAPADLAGEFGGRPDLTAVGAAVPDEPRLQLRGFGDMNYLREGFRGNTNSFGLGQLDLFITSQLSSDWSVLTELVLESGADNVPVFELERLLLRYEPSDYFGLSVGRFHTSIGYYNRAFHHGSWFQTAATRPFVFEFEDEDGPLPVHDVGLRLEGAIPSGPLGLHYLAEIGNGAAAARPDSEPVQNSADENGGKAVNFRLLARPDRLPGWQMGFSTYRDRLTPLGAASVLKRIHSAHVVYTASGWEFLNEALVVTHQLQPDRTVYRSPAYYSQIARRYGRLWPYFRFESFHAGARDPVFSRVGRRRGPAIGLRYEVGEFSALKLQYTHLLLDDRETSNGLGLQFAFAF